MIRYNAGGVIPLLLNIFKNFKIAFILGIVVIISSCDKEKDESFHVLNPLMSINQLSDSSFTSNGSRLSYYDGLIYLCDYNNSRIVCMDTSFKVIRTMGRNGRGPGEFQGVVSLEIINDTIYALDDGNRRINVFTIKGNYVGDVAIPPIGFLSTRFAIDKDGYFYLSSASDKSFPITKFDPSGKVIKKFGNWISPELPHRQRMAINSRHLIIIKDSVLASFNESEPIIEFYSLEGNFISRIDLSENQFLQKRLQYVRDEKKKSGANLESTYILFVDAYITDDSIYLLYIDQNKENKPECYKILTFNYNDQTPYYKTLILNNPRGEGWFSTFCVSPKNIFAYDAQKDELLKYMLETNNEK